MKRLVLALALLAAPLLASADPFTAITVDTRTEHLELFLNDDQGASFRRLDRLDAWLKSQNRQLRFAMNAGMFEPDLSPVGLFVAHGRELKPLNLVDGRGNFFLKPNGVFYLTAAGPGIVRSTKYSERAAEILLATQSGPLLLEGGAINPAFGPTSKSKHIRNGVGVRGTEAIFVISNEPVTFYELATYFKDQLHCQDALYFDGAVSSLLAPELRRSDSTVDLGPMIAVMK
jgi:uncharacterized protein YigE (DUF2233 family)